MGSSPVGRPAWPCTVCERRKTSRERARSDYTRYLTFGKARDRSEGARLVGQASSVGVVMCGGRPPARLTRPRARWRGPRQGPAHTEWSW